MSPSKKLSIAIGVLALGLIGWGAWQVWFALVQPLQRTYAYRITVEVDDNGIVRSGSAVVENTRVWSVCWLPGGCRAPAYVRGEAVYLDLGPRGNLLALLSTPKSRAVGRAWTWPSWGFGSPWDHYLDPNDPLPELPPVPPTELRLDQMPLLLTIRDVLQPKSLEVVAPDNLEATFGPGIRLKRILVESVDAEPTRNLPASIPWLAKIRPHFYQDVRDPRNVFFEVVTGNHISTGMPHK